jgi:hypothetical protein
MKKYYKFSITFLTGIMVGSSAHSALSSVHSEREDSSLLSISSLLSRMNNHQAVRASEPCVSKPKLGKTKALIRRSRENDMETGR